MSQNRTCIRWFAGILHVLSAVVFLYLGAHLKDPLLLPVRACGSPVLVLVALAGLVAVARWRGGNRLLRVFLLTAWFALPVIVCYKEYEFRAQKQAVLKATGDRARRMAVLGRHLVVGYGNPDDVRELVRNGFIAGVFVGSRNARGKSFEQLRMELADLQSVRRRAGLPPLIIAVDQEGGPVSRLSPPLHRQHPLATLPAPGISDQQLEQRAAAYGAEQAKALATLGVNLNFSPVVDLKPAGGGRILDFHTRISERAIAAEPETVTRVALAYSRGLLSQGVVPTLKHFPGLGSVSEDTHHFSARLGLPLEELNARDWYPFRRILEQAPALLMVGHVIVDKADPELPATLSHKVITGIVRKNWKHDGVIISDDMSMAAVYDRGLCRSSITSLNAGTDLLLLSYDWEKVYPALLCLYEAGNSGQLINLDASRARLDKLSGLLQGRTGKEVRHEQK